MYLMTREMENGSLFLTTSPLMAFYGMVLTIGTLVYSLGVPASDTRLWSGTS